VATTSSQDSYSSYATVFGRKWRYRTPGIKGIIVKLSKKGNPSNYNNWR